MKYYSRFMKKLLMKDIKYCSYLRHFTVYMCFMTSNMYAILNILYDIDITLNYIVSVLLLLGYFILDFITTFPTFVVDSTDPPNDITLEQYYELKDALGLNMPEGDLFDFSNSSKLIDSWGIDEGLTQSEFEELDNKALSILREHIHDIEEFAKIRSNHYYGEIVFIKSREKWASIFKNSERTSGRHFTECNVSFVLGLKNPNTNTLDTILHERLHSVSSDEALVTYASSYFLWKYGDAVDRAYVLDRVNIYGMYLTSNCMDEYSRSLNYMYKYMDKFRE